MRHSPGFLGSHLCLEADKRQAPYNLSRAQIRVKSCPFLTLNQKLEMIKLREEGVLKA